MKQILLILTLTFVLGACNNKKSNTVTRAEVVFTKHATLDFYKSQTDSIFKTIDIEIADTSYKIETGLMYRDGMETNQGMLFVFEDEQPRSFYMKNTRFALDIIYFNTNKEIVSFQKNAQPFNESSLPSNAPAQYVLELNAGLSDQWSLQVGDRISWD